MILLVGGSGRLGQAVQQVARGPLLAPPRAAMDLCRPETLRSAVARARPSVVLNVAGWTDVDGAEACRAAAFDVNAVGVGWLGQVCAAQEVPLVHVSTDHVFDGRGGAPYRPDDPVRPVNVYGASKAEGERRLLACGGRVAIVRTAWLFGGPGEDFLDRVGRASASGPARVVADQRGCPTPIPALAAWLARLCEDAPAGPWHIWHAAGQPAVSRFTWARARWGADRVWPTTSSGVPAAAARPRDARLDVEAAAKAYGALDWRVGLWEARVGSAGVE